MPRRWFLLGLVTPFLFLLLALASLALVLRPPPRRVHTQPPSSYVVHGIDVSHHQGNIDWPRVAASGQVDFAWLKATQGVSHTDRRFKENWDNARSASLKVGAYHYYSMCRGGAAQAAHFIETVPRVDGALPPAVDVEADERCNRRVPSDLRAERA